MRAGPAQTPAGAGAGDGGPRRGDALRVAHINSVSIRVPPRTHGGTEWVVYHLVEGLARRGHVVELFASGDSQVSVPVHAVTPRAVLAREDWSVYLERDYEAMNAHALRVQVGRFDLVHAHWPTLAPFFLSPLDPPLLVTYQYVSRELLDYYEANFPWLHGVFVSRAQARAMGRPGATVVHNAVDLDGATVGGGEDDALVIVARMTPRKGIADAIRIARRAGRRLIVVAPVVANIRESQRYFETEVRPLLSGSDVEYIPGLPNREVLELIGRCRGFLFPIQWEEPFGMVVAEAMAVGTPVIAYRRGAMPELIRHGETGFLCDTEAEMVAAIGRLDSLDRDRCRRHAELHFGVARMVDEYLALYRRILDGQKNAVSAM